MHKEATPQHRSELVIHPAYRAKLTRALAFFGALPENEQEMMILIMHNWIIGGDHMERLYGVNRVLMAHEMRALDDPQPLAEELPPVQVRILGRVVEEMEGA